MAVRDTKSRVEISLDKAELSEAVLAYVTKYPDQANQSVHLALELAAQQMREAVQHLIETQRISLLVPKATKEEEEKALEQHLDKLQEKYPSVPRKLLKYIKEEKVDNTISVTEAAKQLGTTRATIYAWIKAARLVGWRVTRRGMVIPAEQIEGTGKVVDGINLVLSAIPDARAAWRFLTTVSPFLKSPRRPIDLLKEGQIDEVLSAAEASGEAFS